MKKFILLVFLLLLASSVGAQSDCAEGRTCIPEQQQLQGTPPGVPSGGILPGKLGDDDKQNTGGIRGHITNKLLPRVINFILVVTISASILFIIVGGIMYVFSMGESERINKAKEMILWALIGLAISVLAFTIVRIVTGIDFIDHQEINDGIIDPSVEGLAYHYQP